MKNSRILKTTLIAITLCLQFSIGHAQVGINQTTPDSSAVLDIKSGNKGLLIPRLTSSEIQAISNPAEGLLAYCTDLDIFCYYNGTGWMALPAWGWKLNLGDPSGNGQKISAHILNPDTKIGIGSNTPQSKLTVVGNLAVGANVAAQTDGAYIKGQVKIGSAPDAGDTEKLEVDGNIRATGNLNAQGNVNASGNINATGKIQENGHALLPIKSIILWYGSSSSVPDGWAICNGSNGTPNLENRFVVGADDNEVASYDGDYIYHWTEEGGLPEVTLTKTQMPSHDHGINTGASNADIELQLEGETSGTNSSKEIDQAADDPQSGFTSDVISQTKHTHTITPEGGGEAHENRPPFFALYYIMRIK